jgi:hypothetical protein
MDKASAHLNAMIPVILLRGCRKYPTQAELNRRLQYLYSADIDTKNTKLGEFQIFGLSSNMLNDRFTGDIKMAEEMAQLLCDIIFDPYLENGVFSEKYVESEKINLIDLIESEINNKTGYSVNRCIEEMCKDEVFAVKKYGTVEDVESITEASLYEAYLNTLKSCKIEIYVTGECDIDSVSAIFDTYISKLERDVKLPHKYPIIRVATEVKRVEEIQDVNQGKICIGFRIGCNVDDKDFYIVRLFNIVPCAVAATFYAFKRAVIFCFVAVYYPYVSACIHSFVYIYCIHCIIVCCYVYSRYFRKIDNLQRVFLSVADYGVHTFFKMRNFFAAVYGFAVKAYIHSFGKCNTNTVCFCVCRQ